jgi:hypothetical protein
MHWHVQGKAREVCVATGHLGRELASSEQPVWARRLGEAKLVAAKARETCAYAARKKVGKGEATRIPNDTKTPGDTHTHRRAKSCTASCQPSALAPGRLTISKHEFVFIRSSGQSSLTVGKGFQLGFASLPVQRTAR